MKARVVLSIIALLFFGSFVAACNKDSDVCVVTFFGEGGTLKSGNVVQQVKKGEKAYAPVFEKFGYDLSWDKEFDNVESSMDVKAVWTIKKFSVTFSLSGGSYVSGDLTHEVEFNGTVVAPVYEKEGFKLIWSEPLTGITRDMDVVGVWVKNSYTVVFNVSEGEYISGDETQTILFGEDAIAPVYKKEGYTLSWDKEFNSVTSDLEINAIWSIKKFSVTFNLDGGVLISGDEVQEITYKGSAIAPIYEKEGYTLSWDKEFNSVTSNLEINGIWTIKKFIVTFDGNGGVLISGDEVQEITYKESAIAPLYLKEHHTCEWDTNFDEITSDLTVSAIWVKEQLTVTFNGNGGILLAGNEVVQVGYDEKVVAPVYKKEGYILTFDKSLDNIKTNLEINAVWNLYLKVNEFNEPDPLGDFILFGEYPQTIKDPSVTVNLDVTDSRGYALGSDGFYYVSRKGKAFTPHSVFSDGEIIYETITYQFRVEPIKWRILSDSDTEYFLFSTIALQAKQFYESNSPREIGGKTIYANNYEHSDIRPWLNNEFLNLAFFAPQINIILNTVVDNSASSTGGSNPYACNNTEDKIYLPSYKELTRSDYGFDEDYTAHDPNRQIYVTDYARVTGANFSYTEDFYGYGKIWLRSPNSWENYSIRGTYNNGHIGDRINAISKIASVAPMLRISK